MFFLRVIILLNFLLFLALKAEETSCDPFDSSLTSTQNLLPTTIQSVSAITGEWLESETDFVVAGPEPVILSRSYSPEYVSGAIGMNWDFNRPQNLVVENIAYSKTSGYTLKARLHHSSGVRTIHEGKKPLSHKGQKDSPIFRLPLSRTRSLTNCQMSEISAKTNLHNTVLEIDTEKNHCATLTGSGHLT